jgi:hypothetical protein
MIDKPGLYPDIPEADYHADPVAPAPSLSSSIAKVLVDQSPRHAWYQHPRLRPDFDRADKEPTRAMDKGSAAHAWLLQSGTMVRRISADDYRTNAAKAARDAARLAGEIPLLTDDYDAVEKMVAAGIEQIMDIPDLRPMLEAGRSEVTGVWQERDVWCRLRVDRLPESMFSEPFPTCFDLKTSGLSVHPDDFQRHMFDMGYDVSAAFYTRGIRKLLPHIRDLEFVFVAIEQDPPYGLSAMKFGGQAFEEAATKVDLAIETWRHCITTNRWPMYGAGISSIDPPAWRSMAHEMRAMALRTRLDQWQRPHDSQKKDQAA